MSDVEVTTEDHGILNGSGVIVIEDLTPEQHSKRVRGVARYMSLTDAIEYAHTVGDKDSLDNLAANIAMLIQDGHDYKGVEGHQLIMQAKLKTLFEHMVK